MVQLVPTHRVALPLHRVPIMPRALRNWRGADHPRLVTPPLRTPALCRGRGPLPPLELFQLRSPNTVAFWGCGSESPDQPLMVALPWIELCEDCCLRQGRDGHAVCRLLVKRTASSLAISCRTAEAELSKSRSFWRRAASRWRCVVESPPVASEPESDGLASGELEPIEAVELRRIGSKSAPCSVAAPTWRVSHSSPAASSESDATAVLSLSSPSDPRAIPI
eukprot:SAG11_NODE_422_length_9597_cov_11.289488_7_plen_222_part_00